MNISTLESLYFVLESEFAVDRLEREISWLIEVFLFINLLCFHSTAIVGKLWSRTSKQQTNPSVSR